MSDRPVDYAVREQVLNPGQSFIVQAPAGSGKTELLVRRFLRLLAVVDAPEEIVAITFTRKAAAEMRERIIVKALQHAAALSKEERDAGDIDPLLKLACEVLARDAELGWQLLQNPARLKIQTIDAFCSALTQQMPLLAGIGGQPELAEDPGDMYREAAANTLKLPDEKPAQDGEQSDAGAAAETLLKRLDNNLPRLRDMLVSMLQKRDQWLRQLVGQRPDRVAMERALRHIVEATLKDTLHALSREDASELADCAGYASSNLDELRLDGGLADRMIEMLIPPAERAGWWRLSGGLPDKNAGDLNGWKFVVELCLTAAGEWRKTINKNQGFPPGVADKQMKGRFQTLLGRLAEQPHLLELFREIRMLPQPEYQDDDWETLEALYQLLVMASAQLQLLFAARNQVDFIGISQAAIQALGAEDDPTDLALYLDYRIRHVLVDEYQDVSISQQELLEKLTAGWSLEDGHSLFLVGDPMQSIYRFRKAEVGVFLNTWQQQRLGQVPMEAVKIEVNFRSDPALVNWVNGAFSRVLPELADSARGMVNFTPAQAFQSIRGTTGVHVHPVLKPKTGAGQESEAIGAYASMREAELVLEQIDHIRAEAPDDSIAILVRARSHLAAITPLLAQRKMPFRAVQIEHLETRPVIQDLLALTRALRHQADRVAWLALLRAPWCGLSLADLLALTEDGRNKTIWQCLQDRARRASLSMEGRSRVERLCATLSRAFARQGRLPFRRWVEGLWQNLGGPATLETDTDLRDAQCYFELLDDLPGQRELAQRMLELYAATDTRADETLQVMTVHAAKGLEFDHVILPGLHRQLQTASEQLLAWSENPYESGSNMLLAPVKASDEDAAPIYDFIASLERRKERYEQGRLLYVAATRARKQLHLIGTAQVVEDDDGLHAKAPRDNTALGQLWPAVAEIFQARIATDLLRMGQETTPAGQPRTGIRRLVADWQLPELPSTVLWQPATATESAEGEAATETERIEYQWAGRAIRHTGSVVHQYLHLMTTEGVEHWGADKIRAQQAHYRDALYTLGVPGKDLDQACAWVEQALNGILADPKGRWLLAAHEEQQSEYALSGVYRGAVVNIIIDRTFIDEQGTRWIVDYKASRHESGDVEQFLDLQQERYREQLEKYAAVMSTLDDRPIRLGLYFPLLRGWREWGFQGSGARGQG